MRLQKRVFRIIVGTLLGLSLVMSFTTNHRTVKAFESIERRFFEQDMFLLQRSIDEEVNRLTDYVSDWGAWDAMYSFMETKAILRFEELLTGANLRALDIDFLAVIDREMNVVVGYLVNDLGGEVSLSEAALAQLKAMGPQLAAAEPQISDSGSGAAEQPLSPRLMKVDGTIYLFGSHPILMTNWSGPSQGMIIVGVDFSKRLQQISEVLGIPCELRAASPQAYPDRWSKKVEIEAAKGGFASVWQMRGEVIGAEVPYALMCRTPRYI